MTRFAPARTRRPLAAALMMPALALGLQACASNRVTPALPPSQVSAIGVNSYLWRASLDTLSFAPIAQADSAGGVIATDWYSRADAPGERVRVSVAILDRDLRADALRVAASRQVLQGQTWVEAPVQAATVQRLEDIILTRARDLRRSAVN